MFLIYETLNFHDNLNFYCHWTSNFKTVTQLSNSTYTQFVLTDILDSLCTLL